MNNIIYTNGIDIDTGTYAIPPLTPEALDAVIRGEKPAENQNELEARATRPESLGVKEGVDPKRLDSSGWGVIFARDADPAVEQALQPLLKLRAEQAGKYFRSYHGQQGFNIGNDSKNQFLARNGAGPGPADPERVPYYLLIVGSPEQIPYSFQSQLDVQYAVGRIHFDALADYAAYAASVVAAETGKVKLSRQATFFGVTHQHSDTATNQSREFLIDPLSKALSTADGWTFESLCGQDANKAALKSRLGGSQTPALLFTAGHGLNVTPNNKRKLSQTENQGALICADWPGPGTAFEDETFFFGGKDLIKDQDANLQGLIALFFACFGSGTPQWDAYGRLQRLRLGQEAGSALQLAPQPFVSYLPRRMLSAPAGGALAVIGHVERTWPSSYLWLRKEDGTLPAQTAAFESTLKRLTDGYPVGAAVEFLNQRYAELTTMLKDYLEAIQFSDPYDRVEFANTWMAANDAQWYTIVGDPAVRLPVVDPTEVLPRPVLLSAAAIAGASALAPSRVQPHDDPTAVAASASGALAVDPVPTSKDAPMSTTTPIDPRFEHAYSPAPAPTEELAKLKAEHKELYDAYVAHVTSGYVNNARIFDEVRRAFMRSHNSTVAMYWILFSVGVGTVIAAIVLALQGNAEIGAVFLGVGVAAFIAYFVSRSTQSVEENLLYITWLGVIYNSYWTHQAWATQRDTAQSQLDKATIDAIAQLERLVDRHAQSVKGRPSIDSTASPPAPPAAPSPPDPATP